MEEYSRRGRDEIFRQSRNWTLELDLAGSFGRVPGTFSSSRLNEQLKEAEEEEDFWENSTWVSPDIEDDTRIEIQQPWPDGLMIEDVSDANSLNSLRFEVDQYSSGEDLEALLANRATLELAALSPELAEYYRTLELIDEPFRVDPYLLSRCWPTATCQFWIWMLWALHELCDITAGRMSWVNGWKSIRRCAFRIFEI